MRQQQYDTLSMIDQELLGLDHTLASLPSRISHRVMVPIGQVAFMPGQLYRTNEILVNLGGGYSCWRTSFQAREILARRRAQVLQELAAIHNSQQSVPTEDSQNRSFNPKIPNPEEDFFNGETEPVEIREKYDPEAIARAREEIAKQSPSEVSPETKWNSQEFTNVMELMEKLGEMEDAYADEHGDEESAVASEVDIDTYIKNWDGKKNSQPQPKKTVVFEPDVKTFEYESLPSHPKAEPEKESIKDAFSGVIQESSATPPKPENQSSSTTGRVSLFKQRLQAKK